MKTPNLHDAFDAFIEKYEARTPPESGNPVKLIEITHIGPDGVPDPEPSMIGIPTSVGGDGVFHLTEYGKREEREPRPTPAEPDRPVKTLAEMKPTTGLTTNTLEPEPDKPHEPDMRDLGQYIRGRPKPINY